MRTEPGSTATDVPDPVAGGDPARHGAVVAATHGVVRRYPGVTALDGVDLTLRAGEVRALLGRNGAGKSTLIKLLSGVEVPDEGEVRINGVPLGPDATVRDAQDLGVATVHQELSAVPELSVEENLFLGDLPRTRLGLVDRRRLRRDSRAALDRLDLDVDPAAPLGSLTLAQQQLVEIAKAMRTDPVLLFLDEPTSSLAATEVDLVLQAARRVAAAGVAVVYVIHRMDEIRRVADAVTVLRDGTIVADEVPIAEAGTDRIVELMLGEVARTAAPDRPTARTPRSPTGTPLLRARGLTAPPRLHGVDLDVHPGEVVGLAGLLGAGRTEALLAIAGHLPLAAGTIEVDGRPVSAPTPARMSRLGIGYTPEHRKRDGIVPLLGVDENIVMSDLGAVGRGGLLSLRQRDRAADRVIADLDVKVPDRATPIAALSGGNQQKVVIGRWLHAETRVLLLDEPTRGVDVGAKAQIYALVRDLADRGAGVVFVSSEEEELPLVCDRVEVLVAGRNAATLTGDAITVDALVAAGMAGADPTTDPTPDGGDR